MIELSNASRKLERSRNARNAEEGWPATHRHATRPRKSNVKSLHEFRQSYDPKKRGSRPALMAIKPQT